MFKDAVTVVIDAGHGGVDRGATGKNGINEQNINLAISKKIRSLSNKYNVNVVMTRDDNNLPGNLSDPMKAIWGRVKMTEAVHADLFISIHVAASPKKEYHGFEIFVSDDSKGNAFQQGSNTACSMMVAALQKKYTTKPQLLHWKNQGIWVLNQAPCPALLIECGYITNSADAEFITDPVNQEKVAESILVGIVAFRGK